MTDELRLKKFFWVKLQESFFKDIKMKKLRKIAGGDTYTIIYLKMQLMTCRTGGIIKYQGVENTLAEEIALELDEDPDNVFVTINFLLNCGLMEEIKEDEFLLLDAAKNMGSEAESTERVRKCRAQKKLKNENLLQCNSDVTERNNTEIECNTEIDIEKETEIDIDKDINSTQDAWQPSVMDDIFVITLPLNDGSGYQIVQSQVNHWQELYPAVDILLQLRKMLGWLESHPKNRKTRRGIMKFINSWLSSNQDKAATIPGSYKEAYSSRQDTGNEYLDMVKNGEFK